MPTGYTARIINGEVQTPKDFLHLCLRAFGILVDFRDDDLTVKDYTSDIIKKSEDNIRYHQKFVDTAEEYLKKAKEMTDDELYEKYVKQNSDSRKSTEAGLKEANRVNALFDQFADKISHWECSPEYNGVKEFALEQLEMSKEKTSYYEEELKRIGELTREDFESKKEAYRQQLIDSTQWEIDYHKKQIEEEKSNQAKSVSFYHFFLQELEKLK
jgi:hypothetical protein